MNSLPKYALLTLLIVVPAVITGCGKSKKPESEGTAETADGKKPAPAATLSGAAQVRAALDKKDYGGAVALLVQTKQALRTQAQQSEFTDLVDEVRIRLLDEAPGDPKATQALSALRAFTGGR